jgi:3-oxoacyl-[acyl-carrier-protein] synthase II/nodulation protein E
MRVLQDYFGPLVGMASIATPYLRYQRHLTEGAWGFALRRVVVTGAGCITPIGQDVTSFSANLFAGHAGIRDLEGPVRGELLFTKVASVPDFDPKAWFNLAQMRLLERSGQFALASTRQAVAASGVMGSYRGEDVAAVFGCSTGGRSAEEPEIAKLYTQGKRINPLTVLRSMSNSGTSQVCIEHGITGPAYTVSTACASGAHAIGQAFHMIRSGMVEAAVAGAHEAPLTDAFLSGWDGLHVVSPMGCRPFAADRDGMTLGEGAATVVLETLQGAMERGATILAEVIGFGMTADASHMSRAAAAGPAAAMRRALRDAGVHPDEVGYISAHGTGTDVNDRAEAEALHMVFGEAATTLPVSSTKGLHGHSMGASGAIEFLATVLALRDGILPAGAGVTNLDESLNLQGVLRENMPLRTPVALSNSFAFGGLNAVIALKRYAA